jgi:hypothetical protein
MARKKISAVARQCKQKNYQMALSNPCFELWILLHIKDISLLSKSEKDDLLINKKISAKRTLVENEIIKILGSYNKSNIDASKIIQHTSLAIRRAKDLDKYPKHRWPNYLATRIYHIVEKIIT